MHSADNCKELKILKRSKLYRFLNPTFLIHGPELFIPVFQNFVGLETIPIVSDRDFQIQDHRQETGIEAEISLRLTKTINTWTNFNHCQKCSVFRNNNLNTAL